MKGARAKRREQAAGLEAALAAARQARGCPACGGVYVGSAFAIHQDVGRCLPGDAYGQLVERDGVWMARGSDLAR